MCDLFSPNNKRISEVGKMKCGRQNRWDSPFRVSTSPPPSPNGVTLWTIFPASHHTLVPPRLFFLFIHISLFSFPPLPLHLHRCFFFFSSTLLQGSREWGVTKVSLGLWNIFLYPMSTLIHKYAHFPCNHSSNAEWTRFLPPLWFVVCTLLITSISKKKTSKFVAINGQHLL